MNWAIIRKIEGTILKCEAASMLLPALVALIYGEHEGWAYLGTAAFTFVLGAILAHGQSVDQEYYVKEGFFMVSSSWILMSLCGAIPLVLCGDIGTYVDAFFEIVSGYTTTGASIMPDVESASHATLFWRSFSHWVGGMGVFVLMLAIFPMSGGHNMHLMRAESPGPSVGKLVPRLRDTAKILYTIYLVLTVMEFVFLIIARMPVFDSICTALGTAGTGGFGIKNDSFGSYTVLQQFITGVFMILFGVNFNAYFFLIGRNWKEAFKIEEVRAYFIIVFASIALITINILPLAGNVLNAAHLAGFQVASIITTTGFATTDFNLWPQFSKTILTILMFIGACAGSTGGGIKVSRILIAVKSIKNELLTYVHPRAIKRTQMDGKVLDRQTVHDVKAYLALYFMVFGVSMLLLSIDNIDFETCFSAVAATINNIGPGFGAVGAASNYSALSDFSKIVLSFDMLAGRLELYPMMILFVGDIWRRK